MRLEMKQTLPDRPIPTQALSPLDLLPRCVNPDREHVKRSKHIPQLVCPTLLLNNVLHQKIIPGRGKRRNRTMEPHEKSFPASPTRLRIKRPKPRVRKLIRRVITKGRSQRRS